MISFIGGHVYDVLGHSHPDEKDDISIFVLIQAKSPLGRQILGSIHRCIVNKWDKTGKSVLYTAILRVDKNGQVREIFS